MLRDPSGFQEARLFLRILCMCSVIVAGIAQGNPWQGFPPTNSGYRKAKIEGTNPVQSWKPTGPGPTYASTPTNPSRSTLAPAALPLTGPTENTRKPFHVLADDLDYFKYEDESNEAAAREATAVEDDIGTKMCNDTKQEEIVKQDCDCQCHTNGSMTSPTVTAESAPLDLVAELENFMRKICSKLELRKDLEGSARRKGAGLYSLGDHCSVQLTYGYDGQLDKLVRYERKDFVTVMAKLQGNFVRDGSRSLIRGSDSEQQSFGVIRSEGQYRNPHNALQSFRAKISNGFN